MKIHRRHPAEIGTGAIGVTAFLVMLGLDRTVAAWLALGISVVPGTVTAAVEWWRKRPSTVLHRSLGTKQARKRA